MTLILLLLGKELVLKPRERWFHAKRLLYVVIGGVILLTVFGSQWAAQSNKAGLVLFEWLSILIVGSAYVVAPYMAAATIVAEKENGTLNLLLLSDLSITQLIAGKLTLSTLTTCLTMLSIVPLFILCVSLGGIEITQILMAFPVVLTTVFAGACLGLFLSCFLEREARMQSAVALAAVSFFVILPALVFLVCLALGWQPFYVLTVVSPGAAMVAIKQAENLDAVAWNCLFNVLVGLPFLPLTRYLLPRLHLHPEAGAGWLGRWRQGLGLAGQSLRWRKRPEISGNPITWKDLHVHYGGEQGAWLKALLAVFAVMVAVSLGYILACSLKPGLGFSMLTLLTVVVLATAVVCGVNHLYGTLSRAAQCCSREQRAQTLALLQTTDISSYGIVMGKSNAIFMAMMPWSIGFICSCAAFLFFAIIGSTLTIIQIMIIISIMLNLAFMVFAYAYMAIYISMKVEQYPTAAALAGFVGWYVAGNLVLVLVATLLAPFTFYLSLLAVPVAGPVLIGNHVRLRLIREFSKIAIRAPSRGFGGGA